MNIVVRCLWLHYVGASGDDGSISHKLWDPFNGANIKMISWVIPYSRYRYLLFL